MFLICLLCKLQMPLKVTERDVYEFFSQAGKVMFLFVYNCHKGDNKLMLVMQLIKFSCMFCYSIQKTYVDRWICILYTMKVFTYYHCEHPTFVQFALYIVPAWGNWNLSIQVMAQYSILECHWNSLVSYSGCLTSMRLCCCPTCFYLTSLVISRNLIASVVGLNCNEHVDPCCNSCH